MLRELSEDVIESIKSAAKRLTGWKRRAFQAEMAVKYCDGSARKTEYRFGWGRQSVETGLNERRTGIRCIDNVGARGRKRIEDQNPDLAEQIRALAEPETQADPKLQTPLAFTRITAKAVHQELAKTNDAQSLPSQRSVHRMLNRQGYQTRRVRKTKPQKKFPKRTRSSST